MVIKTYRGYTLFGYGQKICRRTSAYNELVYQYMPYAPSSLYSHISHIRSGTNLALNPRLRYRSFYPILGVHSSTNQPSCLPPNSFLKAGHISLFSDNLILLKFLSSISLVQSHSFFSPLELPNKAYSYLLNAPISV